MRYEPGREYLVTSKQARAFLEAERQKAAPADTLTDVIAAIAVFALGAGLGFWITVVMA